MSEKIDLRPNDVVVRNGVRFTVMSRTKDGMFNLLLPLENRFESVSDAELAAEWARGELTIDRRRAVVSARVQEVLDGDFTDLSEKARDRAMQRVPYLDAIGNLNRRFSNKKLADIIDRVWEEQKAALDELPKDRRQKKPSCRTLRRWILRANELGFDVVRDIRILVPRHCVSSYQEAEGWTEVDEIVDDVVEELMMRPAATSGADAYTEIGRRIEDRNKKAASASEHLKAPSRSSYYRNVKAISDERWLEAREGKAAARRKGGLFGAGPQGSRPLDQVEIDHTVADVVIVHPETLLPIGRPTITVVLDRWSRMILAIHIGLEPPGWRAVMAALRKAILHKAELLAADPEGTRAKHNWPVFGLMDELILDNGLEFHCAALLDAAQVLGIRITHCPARTPNRKGKIERFFRRLNTELLHTLPGTTKSNPSQRGPLDPKAEARLTLKELQGLVHRWVVDVYMRAIHTTTKETPLERWEQGVKAMNGVRLPESADAVIKSLSEVDYRTLTAKGIELDGLIYSDRTNEHLRAMLADPLRPKKVKVKIDPLSIAAVSVEDYRRPGVYYTVPCTNMEYARDMTLAEHHEAVARARGVLNTKKRITMKDLADSKAAIRAEAKRIVDSRNAIRPTGKTAPKQPALTREEVKLLRLAPPEAYEPQPVAAAPARPLLYRKPFKLVVEG